MANELGTGGLLGSLTGKTGANASSAISHHTAMVSGASGRAKDAATPMITIGNMTVNNDSSDGSVIKTIEKNNQYKPADTSTLKMGGFFSTATGKLESAINKQTELIEKQSAVISGKLEGIQAAVADVSQAIKNAMSAQISAFEEYSAFNKKQNAKTTLVHDIWMVMSKGARENEAATKQYFNANQPAAWSKSDTFSLTKTLPNALAKINENLVTRFIDPKVKRTLISETLKHYQRVYKLMQDIATGVENIRYNTHPIEQYVQHEFDVYNRAHQLGPHRRNNRLRTAKLRRTRDFDTLTPTDIAEALEREVTFNVNGTDHKISLKDAMKILNHNKLDYNAVVSDRSYIKDFLYGHKNRIQQNFKEAFFKDRNKKWEKQKKDPIENISDKSLKALIAPTEKLTKATMLSASSNEALQSQMERLGLAVDTNTSYVEKASSVMDAGMKLFKRFVNFKNIGSVLLKILKFYSWFRTGKFVLGLARGGIGLASSGADKISSGFNWLKDRVPFVSSISDAIAGWWGKAKNYFLEKIGPTIETYVTNPIVGKITNLFDGVFGSGTFDKTLTAISKYSRLVFTAAFDKDPAERERAWSTLKNGITDGFENIVKKYIIPAIAKVTFAIYSYRNFTKAVGKIPGAFSTIGKMWKDGVNLGSQVQGSPVITGARNAWGELKQGNLREATRAIRGGLSQRFNFGKAVENLHGVKDIKTGWDEIHQGFKKFTQMYSAVGRGIDNLFGSIAERKDNNGNVIQQAQGKINSTFDIYKYIEKRLHSIGSAPKATWGFIHGAYTNIKNNGFSAAFNTAINNLKGKFSTLGASIKDLPSKFKAMKTAFGGFGKMLLAGTKGLSKGIFDGAIPGGFKIFAGLGTFAKGFAKFATGVGIPIAIIAFLIKMIMPAFKSAQTKGIGVGQYLKDTIVGWFEKIKKTLYTEVGGFSGLAKMVMGGIVGVIEGLWIGIKSLFNANSAAGLIFNIGKVFLDGVIALIPLLFKIVAKGIKIAVVDIPKALLWDLPKMIIDAVFGGGGKSKKSKVVPHAKGGIVDSPTYFKFAKGGTTQTGLMGEAGPEAILKLKKGKDGVLGVSIADSSNSLQQAIKLLDRTNAVTSSAMRRLTDAITRPNSFYDPKTVKQFTSTFKKLDISSDRLKLLSDAMTRNAGKEITVDNINELAALLYDINTEQTSGNTDTFNQVKALSDSQTKANKDQSKRDTERNKTLTDSKNVTKAIKENLPPKGFWDKFAGWWEDTKLGFARLWGSLIGDYSYVKITDSQSIDRFGATVKDVAKILGHLRWEKQNIANELAWSQPGSDDAVNAQKTADKFMDLLKAFETNSLTESDIKSIEALIRANGAKILGYNPLGSTSGDTYNADNLVKILEESKKFNEDTLKGVKSVLEDANVKGVLQGESITNFMAAINKTPDFSEDILEKIKQIIIDQNGEQVTEDTMKSIVKIVTDIKDNQEDAAENNNAERSERKAAESAIQKQIKSIKEYFVGGKFFADIDKAKMTVGGIMKTIGSSIYNLVTGKQNAVIGNALKDTFGAGFGGLAAGLMGDSKAYELISKINENAVKRGHSDVQRMMTSARHTILSDVSDIAQFTKDTKITSEELASILKDAEKYGWNISSESFKKLDAQIKGIPYVPEGKNGTTNAQTEGTPVAQGNNGKFDFSSITVAENKANQFEFDSRHLDESSKTSLLGSIKAASDNATSDQAKSRYSRLGEAVSTGKYESLSSSDWETLKNLAPDSSKDTVSKMQDTISSVRFETYANELLKTEGGYLSNDAGRGPSNRGILESTLKQAIKRRIVEDTNIKDLTKEDAVKIYKMMYWDDPKIGNLPSPIDYLVFDTNVNGGALNVLHRTLKKLGVNGYDKAKFGKTISAAIDYCQSPEKTKKFGETFLQARVERYIDLVRKDESKEQYFKGWMNRIAAIAKQTGLNSPFKDGKITDTVTRVLEETGSDELEIDNGSINAEKLNEQLPEQATNHDSLIEHIGKLRADVFNKTGDLASKMTDSSNSAKLREQYIEQYNKVAEEYKYLTDLYKSTKNGSDPTESDVKRLNTLAEAYGEKPFDYGSHKTAVADSTKVEVDKQVKEQHSEPPVKSTTVATKPVKQPTTDANGAVKVEAQAKPAEQTANNVATNSDTNTVTVKQPVIKAKAQSNPAKPVTINPNTNAVAVEPPAKPAAVAKPATSTPNYSSYSNKELWASQPKSLAEIENSELPEDEKQRLREDSAAWHKEVSSRRFNSVMARKKANKQPTTDANGAIKAEAQPEPTEQPKSGWLSNWWNGVKRGTSRWVANNFTSNYSNYVKTTNDQSMAMFGAGVNDVAKVLSKLYSNATVEVERLSYQSRWDRSDEFKKKLAEAEKEKLNLGNILENFESGNPLAESEIKLVNTLVKAHGKEILGYDPYKKVVDGSINSKELAKQQPGQPATTTKNSKNGQSKSRSKRTSGKGSKIDSLKPKVKELIKRNPKLVEEIKSRVGDSLKPKVKELIKRNPKLVEEIKSRVGDSLKPKVKELIKRNPELSKGINNLIKDSIKPEIEDIIKKHPELSDEDIKDRVKNLLKPRVNKFITDWSKQAKKQSSSAATNYSRKEPYDNRLDLMEKIISSNLPEDEKDRRLQRIMDSYNDEYPKRSRKSGTAKKRQKRATNVAPIDSTKTRVDELVKQPSAQPATRDDLIKFVGTLRSKVFNKTSDISAQLMATPSDELREQYNKTQEEYRNLSDLYKKTKNGVDLTKSDVELLNGAAKDYGEKPFDYGSHKTAVADSTKVEVDKQVKEQHSEPPVKSTTVATKPVKQPTTDANGAVKVEAQPEPTEQPKNTINHIDDRYADFVQNLIHETELDIQSKSWIGRIKSATSDEPSERSKIEDLKKVLDEINSGSLSADTRNFLNENKDKFESYLSMNAKATQFKMSDAARSGLIELLKKKQDIAAKDKDGGLLTSNSTMVSAKREYEALDKAIKEVQTDSLTNASMDLLFSDKELYKYVKNLSYQPTAVDEAFSKEIPDAAFDLSKTAEKANIKHQQMVQQALEQVTDEDFKKDPYTALQNAITAIKESTALQFVALTKMERPNVANVSNATVSTNNNSSVYANQSNMGNNDNIGLIGLGMYSGSDAILSSSPIW